MTHPNPTFLETVFGPISRWAEKRRRIAEDQRYLHAARDNPGMMADIACAIARAQAEPPVAPVGQRAKTWLDAVAAHFAETHVRPLSTRYSAAAADHRISL
jgi:hypothetical protein